MSVVAEISMSLDGFVAGPEPTLEEPLGRGGESVHDWAFRLAAWRRAHGLEGGDEDVDSPLVERAQASAGAYVMGRKMFSGGDGPWENDPNGQGWWGDNPPFHAPVFVATHHEREPLSLEGGTTFTFVTDGVGAAVDAARDAAGERDVWISGGASVVQQALALGVLDELTVHIAPLFLGGGTRLFENVDPGRLEVLEVVSVPLATHVRYAVAR
jgi:dihydrofolate reductase